MADFLYEFLSELLVRLQEYLPAETWNTINEVFNKVFGG